MPTPRLRRAHWLRRIRSDRNLTQGQLAQRIGVTANQVSRYERGLDDPGLEVFDRILVALECWYVDLLENPAATVPSRRPTRRPIGDVVARAIDIVIGEFMHPSRPPNQYPDQMRCWICHGRPGECHCYQICKVCGLPFRNGHKCSAILHALLAGLAAEELYCLLKCCLIA